MFFLVSVIPLQHLVHLREILSTVFSNLNALHHYQKFYPRESTTSLRSWYLFLITLSAFGITLLNYIYSNEQYRLPKAEIAMTPAALPAGLVVKPMDGIWQPVSSSVSSRNKFWVYSAFLDRRRDAAAANAVRVIAVTTLERPDPVVCLLYLQNRTITLTAKLTAMREHHNSEFSAFYVMCLLSDVGARHEELLGASVSVVPLRSGRAVLGLEAPDNLLIVRHIKPKANVKDKIHVCVGQPINLMYYSNDNWIIEWFEMNILLGVNYFYMYNISMDKSHRCIIDHYEKLGLLQVLDWNLPKYVLLPVGDPVINSTCKIRAAGQSAASNDCLYRAMPNANWLIILDLDELIVPRSRRKLTTLFDSLVSDAKTRNESSAGFVFRNVFFNTKWEDDPKAPVPLLTARKTRRWRSPHRSKVRSKYAVQPLEAVELGTHEVWQHVPGGVSTTVDVETALLHHYRDTCQGIVDADDEVPCMLQASVVDRTAHQWTDDLQARLTRVKRTLQEQCSLT